ncbi:MAG: ATP-binding protein, partial [Hydrogenophaga sp.]|nr:ATP-binding protein [Hydrogenophaga sp.]
LLDNAIKYSPAGSVVELLVSPAKTSLSRAAVSVRNEVGNTGKPDPDKVFSKYYRHRQAQRRTGSGLGLYLVHGLVTNLGGQLTYHDEGERVSFRADFP